MFIVTLTPSEEGTIVTKGEGVIGATGNGRNSGGDELQVGFVVGVAEAEGAAAVVAPGVEEAVNGEGHEVFGTAADVPESC
jgi:hypothetical protein